MRVKVLKLGQLKDNLAKYIGNEKLSGDYNKSSFWKYYEKSPQPKEGYDKGNWDKLRESLKKGYRPTEYGRGFITVIKLWFKKEYLIFDGSHRVKLLKEMYGDEYEVEVKMMKVSITSTLLIIVIMFLILPFALIKKTISFLKNEK
jgi:hypothetical protein